jgi:hypothetical protein
MRTKILAVIVMVLCSVRLPAAAPLDPSKGLTLANNFVRIEFEPQGMGLSALVDQHSGTNHLEAVKGKHLLWEIAFAKGKQIEKVTNNYAPCNYLWVEKHPDGSQRAVMEWNDLRWWHEERVLTVRVTVDLPPDSGLAQWRISVINKSDYWGLWTVAFPLVNGFPEAGKYDLARPVFGSGGQLLRAWSGKIQPRYPSGGFPMQFLALSRDRDSVYLGTRDPNAYAKDFVVDSGEKTLSIVHYAENMGVTGSDYRGYYPVEFGVYQGRWQEAALHYRQWALQQKWVQGGKISQRSNFPEILKNLGVWVLADWVWEGADGQPAQMDAPLLEAQKFLGVPIGVHWYNWHHMKFDNEYPHFLPPKPGFAERVKDLTSQGVLVMPYINGSSADLNIPDFDKFGPHAIVDEAGGYRMHFYGENSGRLLSMCPTQEFWQNTIANLVQSLVEDSGVNGVYVDQVSAMEHELCFNREHGHPVGGGRYWMDGNRTLLMKVRNASTRQGRGPVITSEGADEVFLDLVDGNLTWAQTTDREIPMMEMDLFKPEHRTKAEYLRACGRLRVATKPFLVYGRLLAPIDPLKPVPTFTEDGFGWNKDVHTGAAPAAEGRLWQDESGNLAAFLANYTGAPVEFPYRIDPSQFGLAGGRWELKEINPEGSKPLATVKGVVERSETLAPRELKVIEISLPEGKR